MSIFKRILNFSQESVAQRDKRKAPRHSVGQSFPVKAVINVMGRDDDGNLLPDSAQGQDWTGRLVNISAVGASLQLHPAALGSRGESCTLRLSLDQSRIEIPGTIAQFRGYRDYALCGISLKFPDFDTQKTYLQLVEPVAFGASLGPRDSAKVKQDTPGLHKEEYAGQSTALLSVWREPGNNALHGFDFRMNGFGVRWTAGMSELETYGQVASETNGRGGLRHLTESEQDEVRWLFCLAVPNLSKAVPSDVRKFLAQVVA